MATIAEIRDELDFSEWRLGQDDSIESILNHWESSRFVGLDAPTGSGKSLTAMTVGKAANEKWGGRTYILVGSRALQDQYARDFSKHSIDFRGKVNYGCDFLSRLEQDIEQPRPCWDVSRKLSQSLYETAKERFPVWNDDNCPVRSSCEYYVRKAETQKENTITVTTFQNYLSLVNHDHRYNEADTLICDEAHTLDGVMESYASVEVTPRHWERLKYSESEQNAWLVERDIDEWKEIIKEWLVRAVQVYDDLQFRREFLQPNEKRTFSWLENFSRKLQLLLNLRGDFHIKVDRDRRSCLFRAYYPSELAPLYIWHTTPRILCMSATLEKQSVQWCLPEGENLEWVNVPSTFPREMSPVDIRKPLRFKEKFNRKDEADEKKIKRWVQHQDNVLEKAKASNRRVLMLVPAGRHVQYFLEYSRFTEDIIAHLEYVGLNKQDAIDEFKNRNSWCVLIGAFDLAEGYDFPGDEVEITVLPKLFIDPARFDELIIRRMERDPDYVLRREAQWIAQAVGRGWRSPTDRNHIVITDNTAEWWLKQRSRYIPFSVASRIVS